MSSFREQARRNGTPAVLVYGSALLVVTIVWAISPKLPGGIPFLMRDAAQAAGKPFYLGLVSNIGALIWCAAAVVCFFAASLLRRVEGPGEWDSFFRFAGILTTILLFDDFFLVHDEIVPKYLFPKKSALHINEKVVVAIYGLVALRFVWKFRATILRWTDWGMLGLAVGFLALSVVAERSFTKAFIPTKDLRTLSEDGLKLLGIAGWCYYFVRTALEVVQTKLGDSRISGNAAGRAGLSAE